MVKAKSAKNLSLTGNTVYAEKELNDQVVIITSDCAEVKMGENNYLIENVK